MRKTLFSTVALTAMGLGLSFTPVAAADLGGDCCADLEERVAELEATTARKGNRKVSLAITGWVANILTWWDDGTEDNVYQTGAGTTLSSNVQFTGKAQITSGWSAGYHIHIEVNPSDPFFVNQDTDNGVFSPGLPSFGTGIRALQSYWFLDSKTYGKISLGTISPFSDNVTIIGVDGSGLGSIFAANSPNFGNFKSFFLRRNGQFINLAGKPAAAGGPRATWDEAANCWQIGDFGAGISMDCTAAPAQMVRYDSPVWKGFQIGGSWGEDDLWDIGLKYNGQIGDFKFNFAGAYSQNKDENHIVPVAIGPRDVSYFQIGAYLEHAPTGLFAYGTYGTEDIDTPGAALASPTGFVLKDDDAFYLKGGIRQKWTSLGMTVPYVEYQQTNDMLSLFSLGAGATGSKLERYGVGVIQDIDAAAMSLWLAYKHFDAEITGPAATCAVLCGDVDDFQRVEFGGLILF